MKLKKDWKVEIIKMTEKTKVLIIGSGPAGYTAAIYAARANLQPILFTGIQPGGQLTVTTEIENFPGFENPIEGTQLMEQMEKQAINVGAKIVKTSITEVDLKSTPKKATDGNGDNYEADTIIICTGAQAKWLGIESEEKYKSRGISACATCDGFFYRGKDVAVIGGGNTAVEEALYLTNFVNKVTLIHRRNELRAEKIMQERLFSNEKVEMKWDSQIDEFLGDDSGLTGIRLKNSKTGELSELKVHGAFVAIGHSPSTKLFAGQLKTDEEGYLITEPNSTKTEIEGVFAAGDVKDKVFRQAITAAGMGCMAALEAERYLIGKH